MKVFDEHWDDLIFQNGLKKCKIGRTICEAPVLN